jgi:hypothetical protein
VDLLQSCGWTVTFQEARAGLAHTSAPHSALTAAAALRGAPVLRAKRAASGGLPLLGLGARLPGKH